MKVAEDLGIEVAHATTEEQVKDKKISILRGMATPLLPSIPSKTTSKSTTIVPSPLPTVAPTLCKTPSKPPAIAPSKPPTKAPSSLTTISPSSAPITSPSSSGTSTTPAGQNGAGNPPPSSRANNFECQTLVVDGIPQHLDKNRPHGNPYPMCGFPPLLACAATVTGGLAVKGPALIDGRRAKGFLLFILVIALVYPSDLFF